VIGATLCATLPALAQDKPNMVFILVPSSAGRVTRLQPGEVAT
jgi:hypothetical protein